MKGLIKLFDSNETNFKHNKNVLSECLSAYITEDIEGTLELDLEYPLFDNKNLSKQFSIGKIIKAPIYDNREDQLFKIRKPTLSTSNKTVSIYAQAIGYADLGSNIILGCHIPAGTTRKKAIEMLLNARQQKIRNYHVGNLDTSTNTNVNLGLEEDTGNVINYVDIDYKSPLKGLLDDSENSIYKAYRGELIWDNFEINMVDKRGSDNSFTIRSGKNLIDFEKEISDMGDDFATALIMCSSDGLYLPNNEILYSSLASKYDRYYYKVIKCDDISFEELIDENSTDSDIENAKNIVYEQLRERGQKYFNESMADLLGSYTINFLELAKSEEYKDYAQLTNCSIGNKVTTIYPELSLKVTTRVTKIKYNILKDEIEEITVGNIKKDIADTINSTESKADTAIEKAQENKATSKRYKSELSKEDNRIKATVSDLDERTTATFQITADNIKAMIEGAGGFTSLDLLKDSIEASVMANGLQSTIKQSADAIRIAWNKISNYCTIDSEDGLILGNEDNGTYSQVGYDGRLSMMMNGSEHPYHCLMYEGSAEISCSDNDDYTEWSRSLPSMFDGIDDSDIKVAVSVKKVYKEGYYLPYWFGAYGEISNGDVVIRAMSAWREYSTTTVVSDIDCDYSDDYVSDVDYDTERVIESIGSPVNGNIIVQYIIMA